MFSLLLGGSVLGQWLEVPSAFDAELVTGLEEAIARADQDGPGFQNCGRLMLRAATLSESVYRIQNSDPSLLDRLNSIDVVGQNSWPIDDDLQQFNGSIEVMAQHLWDFEHGLLSLKPAARLGIQTRSFALDTGSLPIAEQTKTPNRTTGWRSVNYVAYGMRAAVDSNEFRYMGPTGYAFRGETRSEYGTQMFGPQISLGRVAQHGRLSIDYNATVMAGYERTEYGYWSSRSNYSVVYGFDVSYTGSLAHDRYSLSNKRLAVVGELRWFVGYEISEDLSLDLLANVLAAPRQVETAAGQSAVYSFSDFGIGNSGDANDTLFAGNVYLSLNYLR